MKKFFLLLFIIIFQTKIMANNPVFKIPYLKGAKIKVDGILDEEAYKHAFFWDKFVQTNPGNNIKPTQKTEMYIFHNGKEIVFAFKCYDTNPEKIKKIRRRRDNVWSNIDSIFIGFDSFGDCKQFYGIGTSSMNDVTDILNDFANGGRQDIDIEFKHATKFYDWGWTAEIVIPFSSINLKTDKNGNSKWYFQAQRYIPRDFMEIISSLPINRNSNDIKNGLAILELNHIEKTGRKKLKLIPEAVLSYSKNTVKDWGRENSHSFKKLSIGLTGEYDFSANTTAKFTIHPDFSQIEADSVYQEINNRYPVYFKEKRPFFMDGMESFSSPIELVYTRNIVKPEYGLKFSTKGKKTGFALISAMEKDVPGERFGLSGLNRDVYWNVFRGNYTFSPGNYIGGFYILRNFGSYFNQVVSIDGANQIKKWDLSYQAVATSLKGKNSTTHGKAGNFWISYKWNQYARTGAGYSFKSPEYVNDMGFIERNDVKEFSISQIFSYQPDTDKGLIKSAGIGGFYSMEYLYNSDFLENTLSLSLYLTLSQRISITPYFFTSNEAYKGQIYPTNGKGIYVFWSKYDKFSPSLSISKGSSILYGDNPQLVDRKSYRVGVSSNFSNFRVSLSLFTHSFNDKQTGQFIRRQRALQFNGEYFFTDRLSLKTMYQSSLPKYRDYNMRMPHHYFYLLLTWQKDGFRKIYAGITNSTTTYTFSDKTFLMGERDKVAFVKASWLF